MFIVGITGGISSGKSTVAKLFKNQGIHIVDADQVARMVVAPDTPALRQIATHFGNNILTQEGSLDRARLRTIIFEKSDQRQWLEALLHPIIRQTMLKELADATSRYAILESPLLFETDQHEMTACSLLVDVPVELQISRTCQRDNNSEEQVHRIIDAQMPRTEKQKKADYIIDNSRSLDILKRDVDKLHQYFLNLAANTHRE